MNNKNNYLGPMLVMGLLFFMMGYITWTNGPLIPYLKIVCNLETDVQAFLVTSAFYFSYFFMSLPSAVVLEKLGFKNGIIFSMVVIALGSLLFIPAANSRTYWIFLTGLFMQGSGLALLQTAVNPYISILGPIEAAAKRISIVGIANKAAGILAPLIVGGILLKGAGDLEKKLVTITDEGDRQVILAEMASRIQTPYIALAIVLIVVAVIIFFSKLPEIQTESSITAEKDQKKSVFAFPNLMLGVVAIICYVGAEVIAGDGIGQYGKNIGISLDDAKHFTSYTMAAMLVGYVVGIIAIPRYIKQEQALKYSALVGIVFCLIAIFTTGYTSILFIALLGLANALMWPAIFPMAINGLGTFTKVGSALLIMGIGPGGGVLPLLYAMIGGEANPQRGFWVIILCYAYILYYAMIGHKKKSW
ncbi:sugar MFS transporter [Dyadobacter sp. CY345]|uniref:sugar MFS transporter n=1 Tax=Dyadobacter sp. CY345 TaxID=2909335 RepID=UPI001F28BBBE|nr:sugar MFS transporter [Dyadobacter sp. CY345]MCF2443886.1 sugar MFS transporter [Dyadobacter sp. CY345]